MLSAAARAQTPSERVAPLKVLEDDATLLVHETYTSLQGEGTRAGARCVFVRLTGCHLRCTWCDTEHAFAGGTEMTVAAVTALAAADPARFVQLTGGEPLLQRAARPLMSALSDAGKTVLLETSGGVSTEGVDPRVVTILDLKAPSSGEDARNVWSNLDRLRAHDEVKVVIADRADYDWAKGKLAEHAVYGRATVLFSPAAGLMDPTTLATWLLDDALDARLQLQLHKLLWGEKRGV